MKSRPITLKILDWLSVILLAVAAYLSIVWAPQEAVMGDVQRVFYIHVAAGWGGMMGFLLAVFSAIMYLVKGDLKWDIVGLAGIEVGLVLSFINIVSGSIWARPIWNTWWTWDPRLVTATIMELVYIAYLMLRQGIDEPERRARFGAIYALVGFVSVPLSFLSIRIWRTIHPVVVGSGDAGAQGSFDMSPDMRVAFFFALFTFTVFGVTLLWHRIRIGRLQDKIERLKMKITY
ncbi:MAG TPA: cytochrome c biogenesis protein CcsA [Anaerolineales bacterium]|nr:cytochrome c biogenesis protein CcsA [Anaerolineales bacterium]